MMPPGAPPDWKPCDACAAALEPIKPTAALMPVGGPVDARVTRNFLAVMIRLLCGPCRQSFITASVGRFSDVGMQRRALALIRAIEQGEPAPGRPS